MPALPPGSVPPKGTRCCSRIRWLWPGGPAQILTRAATRKLSDVTYNLRVPVHVSNIKSCSTSEEREYLSLRIDFFTPGQPIPAGMQYDPAQRFPQSAFLREAVFRSTNTKALAAVCRSLKEIQKRIKLRQRAQREQASLVVQESLRLSADRKLPKLRGLNCRPSLNRVIEWVMMGRARLIPAVARRGAGDLECHANGFRFISGKGEQVSVIFANIKHAIFQPAANDLVVILHFHLHNPIMMGKKKTRDIQFFTEVADASKIGPVLPDEELRRGRAGGERREKEMKKKINEEFRNFVQRVEEYPACTAWWSSPSPFMVITLEDIRLLSLHNFDMVIIFNDLKRVPFQIKAIDRKSLEGIKQWLEAVSHYEGPAVNWTKIMQTVRANPDFEKEGGWSFLSMEGGEEDEEDPDDLESEYDPSGGEAGSGEPEEEDD
ncbi:putative FACT complex subunit spt-16 [Paratrimastix pyriformis]|uniref:FACT complex subunit n=1 Tax=Paratrimastix pyriformis TaxID=342808 RepID=A0ABQ8UM38_9EUKA|nr:putative FACT complex subunit spt-16 [Paratrimastix pyriformis]